jgi:hypothetical protein
MPVLPPPVVALHGACTQSPFTVGMFSGHPQYDRRLSPALASYPPAIHTILCITWFIRGLA